jgi:hypothetical protein
VTAGAQAFRDFLAAGDRCARLRMRPTANRIQSTAAPWNGCIVLLPLAIMATQPGMLFCPPVLFRPVINPIRRFPVFRLIPINIPRASSPHLQLLSNRSNPSWGDVVKEPQGDRRRSQTK